MESIVGKWVQIEGQPYPGLWFEFKEDGSFTAEFEAMGIVSGGTYAINGNEIDMNQNSHTLGLVGEFAGIFEVTGKELKLSLANGPGQERPENLDEARIYHKA